VRKGVLARGALQSIETRLPAQYHRGVNCGVLIREVFDQCDRIGASCLSPPHWARQLLKEERECGYLLRMSTLDKSDRLIGLVGSVEAVSFLYWFWR
jgi:hypothetical protein